jgi:phage baseplate assembly protein W
VIVVAEAVAWHFSPESASGWPGISVDASGKVALARGDAAIRQSLLMLLSTVPGERVMLPTYGCPLHRLMFQPLDHTTFGMAIHYVQQAVRRWEPRAEVLRVDAGPTPHRDGSLSVELHYRCRTTRHDDVVQVEIDLHGARR